MFCLTPINMGITCCYRVVQSLTMDNFKKFTVLLLLSALCLSCLGSSSDVPHEDRKVYIVYMGSKTEEYSLSSIDHLHILEQVLENSTPEECLVSSYGRTFNGFAARLTEKESEHLKRMAGVVTVFPSRTLELQTTRSWDFIGLPISSSERDTAEKDIIIGVLDSGVWPESPSFRDDGIGPAPEKWKGVCNGGQNFTCNNKIIGARVYMDPLEIGKSARDTTGHGSHTASIAAGRLVSNTSFYGLAGGDARGGVSSRIGVYQVCAQGLCYESAILAGFDDAISDGVDIITVSLGLSTSPFFSDAIAIGSFHAMQKGVLAVQAAGNNGNITATVGSVAPWILTVAASSIDRRITSKIVLGDGRTLNGTTINSFSMKGKKFPLVRVSPYKQHNEAKSNCTNESKEGNIIVVDYEDIILLPNDKYNATGVVAPIRTADSSLIVPLPAVQLVSEDFRSVLDYVDTERPEATIFASEDIHDPNAPFAASFSSRGPNIIASDILKPDIAAPGVQILAAYSPVAPISVSFVEKRKVEYNILSGTSMACPHVAAAAAYVKAQHPDWSPSAIKSALMTTASSMSPSKNPDREFAYGAGHVNPLKANNPGLVYEATRDDYITFLCKLNYTNEQIGLITGNKSLSCPEKSDFNLSPADVNYPTMSAKIGNATDTFRVEFSRTVTNVGVANSTYLSRIESGAKFKVTVEPDTLSFHSLMEKKSFKVTVIGETLKSEFPDSGSLTWSDGVHYVRSPIVIYV